MNLATTEKTVFRFSGHETFACRTFWLKKGYDFVRDYGSSGESSCFNSVDAVAQLGVGKNMVNAIRYWMHAFDLLNQNESLTSFAHMIFADENQSFDGRSGYDPFLQHIESLWLLHFKLITTNYASIYSLFFNGFRKQRFEFHEGHLRNYIQAQPNINIKSDKTISNDIKVLLSNYVYKRGKNDAVEDVSAILFADLNLIEYQERFLEDSNMWYSCETKRQETLTPNVLLASMLLAGYSGTVSFQQLLSEKNSPASIFCLTSEQLYELLEQIAIKWSNIVFLEDADIITIQGLETVQFETVMNKIYE